MARAACAVGALLAILLAARALTCGPRDARTPGRAPGGRAGACFDVAGATGRPGLRCLGRPPSVTDVEPLAPCATAEIRARVAGLLRRCPLHGRRIVLAPDRPGGPCAVRVEPLPAAVRLALRIPVDLASATARDLEDLPGVGPETAAAVLRARGRFRSVDDLLGVRGIGEARLRALRPLVVVGPHDDGCR